MSNLAVSLLLFVAVGSILILLSHWHETAVFAQGFVISLILLLVLAANGRYGKEIQTGLSQLQTYATNHKAN